MTKKPIISLIAAIGKNRELGFSNKLIWKIPEDLKFFRQATNSHPVIMGQKTFESIGRVLPKRLNIILTKDSNFNVEGAEVCHSIEQALEKAVEHDREEVFVIGGGQIYTQTIDRADRLYLTIIDQSSKADTYFPEYKEFKKSKKLQSGEYEGTKYSIVQFDR